MTQWFWNVKLFVELHHVPSRISLSQYHIKPRDRMPRWYLQQGRTTKLYRLSCWLCMSIQDRWLSSSVLCWLLHSWESPGMAYQPLTRSKFAIKSEQRQRKVKLILLEWSHMLKFYSQSQNFVLLYKWFICTQFCSYTSCFAPMCICSNRKFILTECIVWHF